MKRILYLLVPLVTSLAGCAAFMHPVVYESNPQPEYNPPPPADYGSAQSNYNNSNVNYDDPEQTDQVFYDELSPYGQWIDYPEYGYVWVPDAGYDFRPYATNGYWAYSEYGWTWISNYRWGWAPFHYGRWFYDDGYGWMWVPGHEWAPAWVTWGQYGDYYCWAPMAPQADPRVIPSGGWNPPGNNWNVVPRRHITRVNVNNYIVRTDAAVIRNVTVINNVTRGYTGHREARGDVRNSQTNGNYVTYNRGPQLNDIENATNTRIQTVRVNDNHRPGAEILSNSQLTVYRPVIKSNPSQGTAIPAPRRVDKFRPGNDQNRGRINQQDKRPGAIQNPDQNRNQRPNNPQQQQARPDINPNTVQPQNQRPYNPQQQQVKPDVNQNPAQNQNQRPNNPQQQQVKPDINQNPSQNQNQRPYNPQQQQVKPDVNQNPAQNQNQRSYNPQQQVRPDVNQNPAQPQNQRPINPQQQAMPDVNQNPAQSQNQRPNNPQQQAKPDVNQNPAQPQNQRPNNPQQQARPDVNQNPAQNQNQQQTSPQQRPRPDAGQGQRPGVQPQQQNNRGNSREIDRTARPAVKKPDTLRRPPNRQ